MKKVAASNARQNLSRLVRDADREGERFLITHHGRSAAALVPVSDVRVPEVQIRARNPFESLSGLVSWADGMGIPIGEWGRDGHKSIEDLWVEISMGDCIIQLDPPTRIVQVVIGHVRHPVDRSARLVELAQQLRDGTFRSRRRPLAEKMRLNERPSEALMRGLREELREFAQEVRVDPQSYRMSFEEGPSPSYPGLRSVYIKHEFDVEIAGVPSGEFLTQEVSETDPVAVHHWGWETG